MLPIFNSFGRHPLLIQALAGEVRRHRKAPGNFEEWRKVNYRFDPTEFAQIREAMGHVLEFALRGVNEKAQRVVDTIAAFRMPAPYDTLAAVLVGGNRICATEPDLDSALNELEDRGLLGWDKRANRYDLHPIVRGVVWSRLSEEKRRDAFRNLYSGFEALVSIQESDVSSLEDLTPIVELYNILIGLSRYDEAFDLFSNRLYRSALYRLNASRQCVELLEILFTNDLDWSSHLRAVDKQAAALTVLGLAFDWSGRPGQTGPLLLRANILNEQLGSSLDVCVNKSSLSSALQLTGRLRDSESTARAALQLARELMMPFVEASSLYWLGLALSARSASSDGGRALYRALTIARAGGIKGNIGAACAFFSEYWIRLGDFHTARQYVEAAWSIAENSPFKRLYARTARRQGTVALGLGNLVAADEKLHIALERSRLVNFVEEELPSLLGLAELRRRQKELNAAREFLDDVWESAKRGPFPFIHADALNVLAQIERDECNTVAAMAAATKAYRLAWCDGPPFAYHWGLEKAKRHLKELGAPEPEMPPFDESKFEPMPEVEIDPDDEFHVGGSSDEG